MFVVVRGNNHKYTETNQKHKEKQTKLVVEVLEAA